VAPSRDDVWRHLDRRLDFGRFVPVPRPDVEVRALAGRDGATHVVMRSPAQRYLRLDQTDFALWERMDGRRSVQEIAVAHFVEHGDFAADRLARLIRQLRADGFLGPRPVDCFEAVEARARPVSWFTRLAGRLNRLLVLELVRFPSPDRLFETAYRSAGWLAYTTPAKALWAVVILVGLGIWWRQVLLADHALFETNGSYTLGLITLGVLDVLGANLHDLARGVTIKRHGRRIREAGVMLYYLVPSLYVGTSDVWLAPRRQRIAVSWSGPCALLVLGSLLAAAALPLDGTEIGAFLFKAATIWLANALFNLLPILGSDGYFMLVDALEMPALRENSLEFVRHGLLPKLRARQPLSRDERIFTAFAALSGLILALVPLAILEARDLRYADTLRDLWNSPQFGAELMAIGMTFFLVGPAALPVLAGLATAGRGALRLGVRRWRQWRGQVPREDIEALAALPFFRDAGRAELVSIARHLEPRAATAGTILVRQGAAGDRLFLIRSGTVRVVKLTSDGGETDLAQLGPGDYFGETALLARVARTASVVAVTDVRLLTLDAGHFRRWLGERVDLATAVRRSLAERHQLQSLPVLRGTGPAELDRLAARLLITRYSPGDEIVRQGEAGDRFFLIADGRVEVVREEEGRVTRLAELAFGDYFGEMALLHDEPRVATVRALTPVETYTLSGADFDALLTRSPAGATIRRTAAERALLDGRPIRGEDGMPGALPNTA
jgi:CRP-like cAMP-binding protein